ncbi:unnamed protein product [Schistosoma turkestanicum]|nr:unnamed protein product [Schistosoma turkestanicum]CAH8428566.1 unnamed protein product [Schistosoma turkestanicum]
MDTRYCQSKIIQARIGALYLPLVRLALEHWNSFGPPGGALQTAVLAATTALHRNTKEPSSSTSLFSSVIHDDEHNHTGVWSPRHHSMDKSTIAANKSDPIRSMNTIFRPGSIHSDDYPVETMHPNSNHLQRTLPPSHQPSVTNSDSDSFSSCLSITKNTTIGWNNDRKSSVSNDSSEGQSIVHNAVSDSTASSSNVNMNSTNAAYLTKDGKVQKHILDQIAGMNQGGALQRRTQRTRLQNSPLTTTTTTATSTLSTETDKPSIIASSQCPRSQSIHSVDSVQQDNDILSGYTSSSTLTLTGLDLNDNNNNNNAHNYNLLNGGDMQRHAKQNCDQDWAKQVLTLAGVYPTDQVNHDERSINSENSQSMLPTASMEIPLDINISEMDDNPNSILPSSYHTNHHQYYVSYQSGVQKIYIPELLSQSSSSSSPTTTTTTTQQQSNVVVIRPHRHQYSYEQLQQTNLLPYRLTDNCQRDLFICLLHILSTITMIHLKSLLQSFTIQDRLHFLSLLKFAIQHLRYRGKHCIQQYEHISHSSVGRTAGTGHLMYLSNALLANNVGPRKRNKNFQSDLLNKNVNESNTGEIAENIPKLKVLLKANLATESSLIILDLLSTFTTVFKSELTTCKPNDPVFRSILETYVSILSNNPSDHVIRQTFSALRVFIHQYSQTLFSESTDILSMLCLAGLKCSNQCFLSLSSTISTIPLSPSTVITSSNSNNNSTMSNCTDSSGNPVSNSVDSVSSPDPMVVYNKYKSPTMSKVKNVEINDTTTNTTNSTTATNQIMLNTVDYDEAVNSHQRHMSPVNKNHNHALISRLCLDACGFLYCLWKCSFQTFQRIGFHRVHLQTIIAISKLVTELSPGFEASLNLLHSLAQTDMQRNAELTTTQQSTTQSTTIMMSPTSSSPSNTYGKLSFWTNANNIRLFLNDIDDLIHRILTVLTATIEIRRHCDDPERLVDLQYALAKSYSSNPALRRTWLEELVKIHMNSKSYTELAMTKLHIAALMAEYLKCKEENELKTDSSTLLEISYTQDDLLTDMNEAALALESAGLFECIRPVYELILPVYEYKCQYNNLAQIYHHIGRAYESISRVESHGHRLFAAYYRVTFHGQLFESMAGKSFIYRSNPCEKLNEKCHELLQLYRRKYGEHSVELIMDNYINRSMLDPMKAYVQVTYVEPYKESDDSNKKPLRSYEKHHDIRQFMFETPFLKQSGLSTEACLLASGPKQSDDLTIQWKRRTILTTEATFPHIRRRLEIIQVTETDFSPIDSAIDAIQCKNQELMNHVITLRNNLAANSMNSNETEDAKQLSVNLLNLQSPTININSANTQRTTTTNTTTTTTTNNNNNNVKSTNCKIPLLMDMQLQGALLPTVNAGPMAYAQAFLKLENQSLYPMSKVNRLKELFFDFLSTCLILLTHYYNLMSTIHEAKYCAMREALDRYRIDLSNLLKEEIIIDEKQLRIGPKSLSSTTSPPSSSSTVNQGIS